MNVHYAFVYHIHHLIGKNVPRDESLAPFEMKLQLINGLLHAKVFGNKIFQYASIIKEIIFAIYYLVCALFHYASRSTRSEVFIE